MHQINFCAFPLLICLILIFRSKLSTLRGSREAFPSQLLQTLCSTNALSAPACLLHAPKCVALQSIFQHCFLYRDAGFNPGMKADQHLNGWWQFHVCLLLGV